AATQTRIAAVPEATKLHAVTPSRPRTAIATAAPSSAATWARRGRSGVRFRSGGGGGASTPPHPNPPRDGRGLGQGPEKVRLRSGVRAACTPDDSARGPGSRIVRAHGRARSPLVRLARCQPLLGPHREEALRPGDRLEWRTGLRDSGLSWDSAPGV